VTAPRKADYPATLSVDFSCERRCQAEVDLTDVHIRFTLGQMLTAASDAHDSAHAAPVVRAFRWHDYVLVRAGVAVDA
jgi:hypothetical protein